MLPDDALVLDVGGWIRPFARADWVLDYMPYETRGLYGRDGAEQDERYRADSWVVRDICNREPYPFEDDQFDFVICAQTLEDVRDPIWVCSELERVGKAGYVEVPSRLEEQSYGIQGPWVGWGHHHWLIDLEDDEITFVFKHHIIHGRPEAQFSAAFRKRLSPEQRNHVLWWEGGFRYRERLFHGPDELEPYLADFVTEHLPLRDRARRRARRMLHS